MTSVAGWNPFYAFQASLYLSETTFSYLPGFLQPLRASIDMARTQQQLVDALTAEVERATRITTIRTQAEARLILQARDLQRILDTFTAQQYSAIECTTVGVEHHMREVYQEATVILGSHGLTLPDTPVYFVERFPAPFDQRFGSALTLDPSDRRAHGVEEGIYFKTSDLLPLYSPFLLLHEIIHLAIAHQGPGIIASSLEEGLCDLIGGIWLSSDILGTELTHRLFVLNRLSNHYDPVWERYLDSTRWAYALLLEHGLDGLLNLVKEGRTHLNTEQHAQPRALTTSNHEPWHAPADQLLLRYPRAHTCTPAALLFAEAATSGTSITETAHRAQLNPDLAHHAAMELRNTLHVITLNHDTTTILETIPVLIQHLRYDTHNPPLT